MEVAKDGDLQYGSQLSKSQVHVVHLTDEHASNSDK